MPCSILYRQQIANYLSSLIFQQFVSSRGCRKYIYVQRALCVCAYVRTWSWSAPVRLDLEVPLNNLSQHHQGHITRRSWTIIWLCRFSAAVPIGSIGFSEPSAAHGAAEDGPPTRRDGLLRGQALSNVRARYFRTLLSLWPADFCGIPTKWPITFQSTHRKIA